MEDLSAVAAVAVEDLSAVAAAAVEDLTAAAGSDTGFEVAADASSSIVEVITSPSRVASKRASLEDGEVNPMLAVILKKVKPEMVYWRTILLTLTLFCL